MSIQAKKRFRFSVLLFAVAVIALILLNLNWSSRAQVGGNSTVAETTAEEVRKTATLLKPIAWVGTTAPALEESIAVLHANETIRTAGKAAGVAEIEEFIRERPESPWTPSLRNYLGAHYHSRGRSTLALEHWQAAWELTKGFQTGGGKQVADLALAHWTRLLVLLGRTDELTAVYQAHGNRVLDRGPLSQMWVRTHEKHLRMLKYSQDSYKCGIYALDQVAQSLKLKYKRAELLRTASKPAGFSLMELQELSGKYGFGLIPVRRLESSDQLIVPSVVHWQQEHFGTITELRGDRYRVADPSGLGVMWLTAAEINAEASGYFMILSKESNPNFAGLTRLEASLVYGRGSSCPPEDAEDIPCGESGSGSGTGSGGGTGGNGGSPPIIGTSEFAPGASVPSGESKGNSTSSCSGCTPGITPEGIGGLPTWRVSEPHLNLWVDDMPLHYQPAKGPAVEMKISYKQRYEPGLVPYEMKVGNNWKCNWSSAVSVEYDVAYVRLPSGGILGFEFPPASNVTAPHYRNNSVLEKVIEAAVIVAYILHFPDGSKLTYHADDYFQLGEQMNPQGHKLTFNYENSLLTSITDADGNDTELHYENNAFPDVVTRVVSPDGREVQLTHDDSTSGMLTNIVDAVGISTAFAYDYVGWLAAMTTPYGTTSFDMSYAGALFDRSVVVTQPDGGKHVYMLVDVDAYSGGGDMPTGFASSQLPTNTPFATGSYPYGTLEVTNRNERNTFYWNPQQFAALSTATLSEFTWTEFKRARTRHWLWKLAPGSLNHVDTLGHEQAPSPDGTTEGQITWYDYDGKDHDSPEMRGTQVMPAVVARVMPDGSTWYEWYQRNTTGHPTKQIEKWQDGGALYRTNVYVYAANGHDVVAWTNATGVLASSNIFNASGQVATNFNALGEATVYTYNATTHLLTSISRPSGLVTTNIYDGDDRLQQTTDLPINRTRTYTWYTSGNVKTVTDERGLTVTNFWDGLNRLTGTRYPDGTTTTNLFKIGTTNILDLTATKDRLGHWTYFGYDGVRRKVAVTNANNVVTRYGYCDCGAMSYVTNAWNTPVELVTWFEYDFQGNRIYAHHPDATVTNWFDSLGRRITTGDTWGYRWFGYDNLSRLIGTTNAYGPEQITVYDVEDHPIHVTDANNVTITNTYDDLDRLRTRTYPDGGAESFGYSARGMIAYTNQLGFTNFYAYDEAGRKTFETNANWELIRYTNNAAGDLLALVDGKNQVTKWNYDEYGRVTNKFDQAGVEILRYTYDADSRLTNRWSTAKGNTYYAYDPVGNLTNINYPASTDVRFQYDPLNRVTNMVDAAGTTKYAYAAGGQLWTEDGPFSNDTVTNSYTSRLRTGLDLQQPTGKWTNLFAFDAAKRLTNVTSPAGSFAYTLGAASAASPLIKKLALPNTSYITNTYDNGARLRFTKLLTSSSSLLDSAEYGYNAGHQRTTFTNAAGTYVQYTNDPIGQLKIANSSVNTEDRGYTYDAAWNLNYRTNNGALGTFTVDSKNQLTSEPAGSTGYDSNGNLTSYQNGYGTYTYDDENRLASAQFYTSWRTTYTYDGHGRLRLKNEYTWSGGAWNLSSQTSYLYDGWRVIQERLSNTPTVSYTRGTDLSGSLEGAGGIGGLLARSHGYSSGNWSTHNFYHADGNGNITYLVNSSQTLAASYRYDPFGNTTASSGSLASANVYRFSSKESHANSGLYYYGYRWYAPSLQRWVNRDPIEEEGGMNLYAFVGNRSTDYVDSDGRWYDGPMGKGGPVINRPQRPPPSPPRPKPPQPKPSKPKPKPPVGRPGPPGGTLGLICFILSASTTSIGHEPYMGPRGWVWPEGGPPTGWPPVPPSEGPEEEETCYLKKDPDGISKGVPTICTYECPGSGRTMRVQAGPRGCLDVQNFPL